MPLTAFLARSVAVGAFGAVVVATGALCAAPSSLADPPPNCSAADRAGITAGVQAATSAYLFTHPDVNAFMTGLTGTPVDEVPAAVQDYLNANPQTKAEIQAIRQPLADMRERCGPPLIDQP